MIRVHPYIIRLSVHEYTESGDVLEMVLQDQYTARRCSERREDACTRIRIAGSVTEEIIDETVIIAIFILQRNDRLGIETLQVVLPFTVLHQ